MDFYAVEFTSKKKDEKSKELKNKIPSHVFTKEEVINDLSKNREVELNDQFRNEEPIAEKVADDLENILVSVGQQQKITTNKEEGSEVESDGVKSIHTVSPNFKNLYKKPFALDIEQKEIPTKLDEKQKELVKKLINTINNFSEVELEACIDDIANYRKENLSENKAKELDDEIKENLLKNVSAQFAYNGIKNATWIFQLLDLLGIRIASIDLKNIPDEIIYSDDMKNLAIRYLLWFAGEYALNPFDIVARINAFVDSGIVMQQEIYDMPKLQEVIEKNLIEFLKTNQKDPREIERKIEEYALAGLISRAAFKNSAKVKELSNKYITQLIEKNIERTEHIERKIIEYENYGFINRSDIRNDQKIQKIIEKFIAYYVKMNPSHPRKIKMKIEKFYKQGLISPQVRENFLRFAK